MPSDFWMRTVQEAEAGRLTEAIASARVRQRTRPRDAEACELLGLLLLRAREPTQAAHHLRRATELEPGSALLQSRLADALMAAGDIRNGISAMRRAVELDPSAEDAWLALSAAQLLHGDTPGAAITARDGLSRHPASQQLAGNHAIALARTGRIDEAIEGVERFLGQHPDATELRSNLLLMLQYTERDAAQILAAHRAYGAALPAPTAPALRRAPSDTLRVGILSSDLGSHSVGFFVQPLLAHAPKHVQVTAFSNSPHHHPDAMRDRFRSLAGRWHEVHAMDDAALDALVRRESIDVLVELNGHTGENRLPALARKPAPCMVSAIGYPDTTGVTAIDARVADSTTDPAGSEVWCTERLLRLDPCFLCYTPPDEAPEPAMPPDDAPITFASFNNVAKLVPRTVELWSSVLKELPGSRLLLKSIGLEDATIRGLVLDRFASAGIARERVELLDAGLDRGSHLALYRRVHVALDPTPYNGTTTTCEALWMGVPVITLQGARHASRVSSSLLQAVGFGEWITRDAAGFTRAATGLAHDHARLRSLRASMRDAMRASPLLDARAYATRFFSAISDLYSNLP